MWLAKVRTRSYSCSMPASIRLGSCSRAALKKISSGEEKNNKFERGLKLIPVGFLAELSEMAFYLFVASYTGTDLLTKTITVNRAKPVE